MPYAYTEELHCGKLTPESSSGTCDSSFRLSWKPSPEILAGNVAETKVTSTLQEASSISDDELPSDRFLHEPDPVEVNWSAKRHRRRAQTTCTPLGIRQRSR